ncbi:MAG: secD secF, partial [Phycisphaerales bacterium]|nr:secD secF [Phycisphaerales bacterium]
ALLAIFWPSVASPRGVAFNPAVPLSQKLNLKPGIDIVGGTSLLYEIKAPEGAGASGTLAEQVTAALKRRVDPQGTQNLIWRPQNPNRLEIQMPLTGSGGEGAARQQALESAREKLEATNVRVSEAMAWVEQGPGRPAAKADELAKGSAARKKILTDLAAAADAVKAADAALDPAAGVKARNDYNRLQDELAKTNLSPTEIERRLAYKDKRQQQQIDALKAASAGYPERAAAVDAFVAARQALATATGGGLESATDLKRRLRGAGVLEFHILPDPADRDLAAAGGFQTWEERLRREGPRVKAGDAYRWFEVDNPDEFKDTRRTVQFDDRTWVLASIRPQESLDASHGSWKLADANPRSDTSTGQRIVSFDFDSLGGRLFGDLTTKNVGKPMAIMLDGRVVSAPNINTPITGGSGQITGGGAGGFGPKELDYLVSMLKAGSLPGTLSEEPIYERTVGPQLGEENLRRGLLACGLGLVVVAVFLTAYYYLAGLVAFAGVLLNVVIILGAMAAINATFTLPGIAAIVLTVGSAVDANVLIFERLREEQHRGLPLRAAIRNAYDRAFSAILDSNMTTIITSAFLILFGTEEVKGFGITLIIGIAASLFTSLYVTKTVFGLLTDKFGVTRLGSLPLSIPRWDEMLKPKIRWTRLALPAAAVSALFVVVGLGLFARYWAKGEVLDIEFASGTAITFEVKEPTPAETVRGWINDESRRHPDGLPTPSVVRVGTDDRTWEVVTPNQNSPRVRDAVLAALGDHLRAERPSKFAFVNEPLDKVAGPAALTAAAPVVFAVTPENLRDEAKGKWPGGVVPDEARRYVGGAAIVLRGLDPPVSPKDVTARLNRQKLQVQPGQAGGPTPVTAEFTVVATGAADKPATDVVVLTVDPSLDARRDEAKWREAVVAPLWDLINQAVASPPQLQQVKNVDASVAGETQRDAAIALVMSMLFIMAYVWARFGNLKYGTATIVALLHDVLFCLAAVGFAHLLSGNAVGDALQLQPFRINLTLIAAILTIMGYSMLDTIVVFDRIRENRGKYGLVSASIINDAINQTLSRTILTASSTVVSVAIMYFVGGEGIHGFTFVLFVGILAGTYSSIAIAAPLLLVGRRGEEAPTRSGRPTAAAT